MSKPMLVVYGMDSTHVETAWNDLSAIKNLANSKPNLCTYL